MTTKTVGGGIWTLARIREEMTEAGSHWWDRDTTRFFRTKVHGECITGTNGIFFVTSEAYREESRMYTVRKYIPSTKDIETCGKFNEIVSREDAYEERDRLAGRILVTGNGDLTTIRVVDQLVTDLKRAGIKLSPNFSEQQVRRLIVLAKQHHRAQEARCNGEQGADQHSRCIEAKINRYCARISANLKAKFQGDPRGCTFKLVLPNGATNDFGKEGWCVPTSELDD